VSRRLSALELTLGTRLFARSPEGLTATPAAEALVPAAERMADAMNEIERRSQCLGEGVEGVVRLTAPEAFAGFIVKRLGELRDRHPALVVELTPSTRVLDIARGEADVAFRFTETTQPDVKVKKLLAIEGAMYAARAYLDRKGVPAPVEQLGGHDVVDYGPGLADVPGARWIAEHRDGATVVFRGSSLLSVLDAACAGIGLAVVPVGLAAQRSELTRVSRGSLCSGQLSLAVHPDLADTARVRALMDFLEEVVRRDRSALTGA